MLNEKKLVMLFILCSIIIGTVPVSALSQDNDPYRIIENNKINVPGEPGKYTQNEIIVKFRPDVSQKEINEFNSRQRTAVIYSSPHTGFKVMRIPRGKTVLEMAAIYSKNPNVEYAEPNYVSHAFMIPNDPYYYLQWHLDNTQYGGIHMETAWEISPDAGSGVTVAVVDTGVAYENRNEWGTRYYKAPDLAGTSFVAGYDFVNGDSHANDDHGHGTHVTGTIAQTTNNGMGVAGVAYKATIMPVKVLDQGGSGYHTWIAEGIYWATDHGAQVISLSLGGPHSDTMENAIKYAYDRGVTLVCASGNENQNQISYPAAYPECISVGATRYDEGRASYSNYGTGLDIVAPGGDFDNLNGDIYMDGVLQMTFDGPRISRGVRHYDTWAYYFYAGTSMATPHVSGVAAMLIAEGYTRDQVRDALLFSADDLGAEGYDIEYGYGLLNATAALLWTPIPDTPNTAPAANNDAYTTDEDTTLNVAVPGVLANDTDTDGDPLTAILVSGASNGSLTLNSAGSFTYIPNTDYHGSDSFTYIANDGRENSAPATVTITINAINDAPNAYDDTYIMNEDTTLTVPAPGVLDNDIDADGDSLTAILQTGPDQGTITLNGNGSIIYTPNSGFNGTDTFTYNASDGALQSTAVVTIIVNPEIDSSLTMHISSITMTLSERTAGRRHTFIHAIADVTVVYADGSSVEGATVSGHWSGETADSDSGLTNSLGGVSLSSDEVKNPSGTATFTFTVDDVVLDGVLYNSAANVETSDSVEL